LSSYRYKIEFGTYLEIIITKSVEVGFLSQSDFYSKTFLGLPRLM